MTKHTIKNQPALDLTQRLTVLAFHAACCDSGLARRLGTARTLRALASADAWAWRDDPSLGLCTGSRRAALEQCRSSACTELDALTEYDPELDEMSDDMSPPVVRGRLLDALVLLLDGLLDGPGDGLIDYAICLLFGSVGVESTMNVALPNPVDRLLFDILYRETAVDSETVLLQVLTLP